MPLPVVLFSVIVLDSRNVRLRAVRGHREGPLERLPFRRLRLRRLRLFVLLILFGIQFVLHASRISLTLML